MKKMLWALIAIATIIIGISVIATRIDKGEKPHFFDDSKTPGIDWISVNKNEIAYSYWGGAWMTIEDVIKLSEKGTKLSGRDLWEYNFYEIVNDGYQRRYDIEDYDMLFELYVKWDIDVTERFSAAYDPVDKLTASEAILIAKDGLDTKVDFFTGDVEAYIDEHRDNPAHNVFSFAYYPIEVEGTNETMGKIAGLWEEGETYVSSNPDELIGLKLDNIEEMDILSEELQYELTYTDKAVPANMFLKLEKNLEKEDVEPKFILYLPKGYTSYKYTVSHMEKRDTDLYISVKKEKRSTQNMGKDGCLIGLMMVQHGSEPSTIRNVKTVHIDLVE